MAFRKYGGIDYCDTKNSVHCQYSNISNQIIENKSGLNRNTQEQFDSTINMDSNSFFNVGCIYFLDGSVQCSIAGERGATGPTGPAGPIGIQGPEGPTGPTGAKGVNGGDTYWFEDSVADGIYYNGGNVVIGATSGATGVLDVIGNVNISQQLNIYTRGTNYTNSTIPTLTTANVGGSLIGSKTDQTTGITIQVLSNFNSPGYYYCNGSINLYVEETNTTIKLSGSSDGSNEYYNINYKTDGYVYILPYSFTFYAETPELYIYVSGNGNTDYYRYVCNILRIA